MKKLKPYLYLLPTMIFLIVFCYVELIIGLGAAFTDYRLGSESIHFVGIDNFIRLTQDSVFKKSLINQVFYTGFAVAFNLFFPFLAAELLSFVKNKIASSTIKMTFIIPMLIPTIVVILIWKFMYNEYFGFNSILDFLNLSDLKHNWLADTQTALTSVILIGFPFISGLYFLIYHSAINGISNEVQEAAQLDGCTGIRLIRYIHIPTIKPYIRIIFMLSMIGSLQNYGLVAATTGGGPGYDTYMLSLHMYKTAFGSYEMGYASSMGIIIIGIIVILTIVGQKFFKEKEDRI